MYLAPNGFNIKEAHTCIKSLLCQLIGLGKTMYLCSIIVAIIVKGVRHLISVVKVTVHV